LHDVGKTGVPDTILKPDPADSAMNWTPERMLLRLDGDAELATQLAAIFIEECPRMLERLRRAVASGSADEVRRAAHALKGSVSNFVDGGPTATASELETMGRNGQLDGTRAVLDRLEREIVALAVCRTFNQGGRGLPRVRSGPGVEEPGRAGPRRIPKGALREKRSQLPTPKLQLPTWKSLGGYGFQGHGIWKLGVGS
jgi:HPt (histidine-containing phosphotransfer) domain-containing protein